MESKHPLRVILKRLCFFFLAMYLASLFLWIAGNEREFLDSTQSLLLRVLTYDAITLGFFSIIGFVSVFTLPSGRPKGSGSLGSLAAGLAGYLLLLAIAVVGLVFGEALMIATTGIN